MNKYFEQFKNLEICDFRIDEISFKNFRGFENENKISFLTNSKIPNSLGTEEVDWVKSKPKKYSKIIGIYGKNASGKTTTIDAILQIFYFLNATILSNIGLKPNLYIRPDFIGNLLNFTLFKNNHPAVLAISISSLEVDFIYELTIEKTINANTIINSLPNLDIHEKIIVQRFKGEGQDLNREIWNSKSYNDSSKNITNRLYFMQYRIVAAKEIAIMENNLRKASLNQAVQEKTIVENAYYEMVHAVDKFQKLVDDKKYEKGVQRILNSFLVSMIPFDVWSLNGMSSELLIGERLSKMVLDYHIDIKKINKLLTVAGNAVDKNIAKIEFRVREVKSSNNILKENFLKLPFDKEFSFNATMANGKNIPLSMLSGGVLNFIWQFCSIYFAYINVPKEVHKYLLIDELGSNWHSFLGTQFINIFKNDILENCTLFFTSHNPRLADGLRNDSVYIIDNEHQITRLTDTKIRNSEKFSNKYSNTNIDWFDTTPSLDDFDNLIDFFDET